MFDFTQVTEVRLSTGAHDRPEQGMCFMEMAAWFAGERHSDKPKCVSPSLGVLGIHLNDTMPERQRDEMLKPMIPHVVGTTDHKNETRRAEYICFRAFNYAFGFLFPEFVERYGPARDFGEARHMIHRGYEEMHYRKMRDYGPGDIYAAMKETMIYGSSHVSAMQMGKSDSRIKRRIADLLQDMFRQKIPYDLGFEPSTAKGSKAMDQTITYPNESNAKSAAAIFAHMTRIVLDWSAAIDTLREAIKIGRHDGFDAAIDLDTRHKALKKLPSVPPGPAKVASLLTA